METEANLATGRQLMVPGGSWVVNKSRLVPHWSDSSTAESEVRNRTGPFILSDQKHGPLFRATKRRAEPQQIFAGILMLQQQHEGARAVD